jgi:hypothetical protein
MTTMSEGEFDLFHPRDLVGPEDLPTPPPVELLDRQVVHQCLEFPEPRGVPELLRVELGASGVEP